MISFTSVKVLSILKVGANLSRRFLSYSQFEVIDVSPISEISKDTHSHLTKLLSNELFDPGYLAEMSKHLGWENVSHSIISTKVPKTGKIKKGTFEETLINAILEEFYNYHVPVMKLRYLIKIHLNKHFIYHKRLIKCGRRKLDDRYLYLYLDKDLELEETKTLYRKLDEGIIDRTELDERSKVMGKILIVSSLDLPEIELFELFKKRERVEKMFDAYKNVLDADRLYLQDDESVFGHVFVSFLSLYAYCKIESMLKKAK